MRRLSPVGREAPHPNPLPARAGRGSRPHASQMARDLAAARAYPAISSPAFAYTTPPSTAMVLPTT
ncbi:hypothetical protein C7U92_24455 [Bradyrhizobium sp. WBOS7]|uniref:Uncharacterized protein n=1 Tax=Bradyrhizobium betae TaxID=244734 RepID=A0AAE9NAM2_9BRAD|nr:hypothetical protein [Bradyrhizobium sp. WBOS2]MDD1573828.1 hypothetical protein [Bradyrhizobium sp. WBOS1]MDD1579853.1 hypothetical protein [Bradyrhizobium sp. WBOS7]MDD1602871.1 hypothetical protein [Bradyrhizobium sp. WBOS16]UUO34380.1 hypothetical protein DCK84_07190 [Bradyrhizobium sp. WBOS01]UUO40809.1 hypothetical protein DCM75_08610 [Bradyrhizobium sp. WBOS02]UUO52907.1 hypothetical protein DCM79_07880 [Bradyrhizobium sp. WBOS07]UUO65078.1 hypothetical protein DCM83_07505 [Bradyrh